MFFEELDYIKDKWICFKDKPHKQIYTKKEEALGIMSVFYRFKLETNMFKPYSLMSEIDMIKDW